MPPIGDDLAKQVIADLPNQITAEAFGVPIQRQGALYVVEGQPYPLTQQEAIAYLKKQANFEAQRLNLIGGAPPTLQEGKKKDGRSKPKEDISRIKKIYPANLRALSIGGAFAYVILTMNDRKPAELRTWPTNFRGPCLLHVSQTAEWDDSFEDWDVTLKQCPKSSILGIVNVTGCNLREDGDWGHVMSQPLLLPKPILRVPGARNYWKPTRIRQVEAFNQAWQQILELGGYPPKTE